MLYLQSRKKGLLSRQDLGDRVAFCREVLKQRLGPNFWRKNITFYLDGTSFQYKTNQLVQARAPKSRTWRKKQEGFPAGFTAKDKKEGSFNANFVVAIAYNSGVVLCEQHEGAISGEKFANIVRSGFPEAFILISDSVCKRFLMDGCPRQNSKKGRRATEEVGGIIFKIPSRSPDLNPIEKVFNLTAKILTREAVEKNITYETFIEFSALEH